MSCCPGSVTRVAARCKAKFREYQSIWNIIAAFLPLASYTTDVTTDVITSKEYLASGNYWWGGLTITFTALPLVITFIMNIIFMPRKCKTLLFHIAMAPFYPFYCLLMIFIKTVRDYPNTEPCEEDDDNITEVAESAPSIKLFDVLGESLPQSMIQTYVSSQVLRTGETIATFQWVSIASSLIAVAYGVATTDGLFKKAQTTSKVVFGMFGLLAMTTRLVVCGVYAIHSSPMWFIPFCSMVVASVLAWAIVRCCPCFGCVTLADEPHRTCHFVSIMLVIFTWIINTFMNSFTLPGLLVSSVTLFYALGALILNVSHPILITAITLSAVSWASNVIFALVPLFKGIRNDWIIIDEENTPAGASSSY